MEGHKDRDRLTEAEVHTEGETHRGRKTHGGRERDTRRDMQKVIMQLYV